MHDGSSNGATSVTQAPPDRFFFSRTNYKKGRWYPVVATIKGAEDSEEEKGSSRQQCLLGLDRLAAKRAMPGQATSKACILATGFGLFMLSFTLEKNMQLHV